MVYARHCGLDPQSIEILATKYKDLPDPEESSATAWDLTPKSRFVQLGNYINCGEGGGRPESDVKTCLLAEKPL